MMTRIMTASRMATTENVGAKKLESTAKSLLPQEEEGLVALFRMLIEVASVRAHGFREGGPGQEDRDKHQHVSHAIGEFDETGCITTLAAKRVEIGEALYIEDRRRSTSDQCCTP